MLASLLLGSACANPDATQPTDNPEALQLSANPATLEFYVSPTGSPTGDGSFTNPWDLQTALSQPAVVSAGSTIWLRGGVYTGGIYFGGFASRLTGTAEAPIIVRQYPGERATVTNHFYAAGSYTWFWGFEITSSAPTATDTDYEYLIYIYSGVGQRLINLVLHDGSNSGVASFAPLYSTARQSHIYGCLIYNNGTHFNHDHGLYLQNDVALGNLTVSDNIVFNNEAFGLHIYSEPAGRLSGFHIEGNVLFGNGSISVPVNRNNDLLIGGAPAASDIVVRNNYIYRDVAPGFSPYKMATAIGYTDGAAANGDVVLENNYLVGGLYLKQWASAAVRANLFYDYGGPMVLTAPIVSGQTWDANQFYGDPTTPSWLHLPNVPADFAIWKTQTGFTNPGDYVGSGAPPNLVVVRPNQYEPGRANIIVYNWAQQGTVSVDLSGVLEVGESYVVQNVQDFYGPPSVSGTYTGGTIQLPMAGVTPAAPVGRAFTPPPVTGPTFNVFVVMQTP